MEVCALIPRPAVSGCRFPQDSCYSAWNFFLSTCCGSRPWHSWGRKPSKKKTAHSFGCPGNLHHMSGGLGFHSSSTCKGSHSHSGVCANIQPSFSPGNRQVATILIWEQLHSTTTMVSRHCINIPTYSNATKYETCEEQAASITRRVFF